MVTALSVQIDSLLAELHREVRLRNLNSDDLLRDFAWEEALPRILALAGSPEAFLHQMEVHPFWRTVMAEAMEGVCAKPREAAAAVTFALLLEMRDGGS